MKRWIALMLLLFTLSGICGCARNTQETNSGELETVSNIFTAPTKETAESEDTTEAAESEDTTEAAEPVPTTQNITSITNWGLPEYELDDVGHCVIYEGGEMNLPYTFTYSGSYLSRYGVALYLCIDGQLQPFKTDFDDTVQYVHILYPEEATTSVTVELELIFTPVTGESGDVLDLNIVSKQYPQWQWGDTETGMSGYTSAITTRIKFTDTPPAAELPASSDRVISWECIYEDATESEYQSWSQNAYNLLGSSMRIGGEGYTVGSDKAVQAYRYLFSATSETTMEVTLELMNTSGVDYGVILFVDNRPVSTAAEDIIYVRSGNSQKAILTVSIDMSDFERQSKVYAFIVPRNYIATVGYTSEEVIDFVDTLEFFLFAQASWTEVLGR